MSEAVTLGLQPYEKETSKKVFPSEYCKSFQKSFFIEQMSTPGSAVLLTKVDKTFSDYVNRDIC